MGHFKIAAHHGLIVKSMETEVGIMKEGDFPIRTLNLILRWDWNVYCICLCFTQSKKKLMNASVMRRVSVDIHLERE